MPFKNKNRKLRNYSIVRLFVAVFLFVGVVSVLSFLSKFVFAAPYTEVIKSIELTSQRSSFASNAPGSWHVTKSAQWIEEGKARITFDVDTVRKTVDGTYTDIIMVIDNSGSMSGNKMTQVKSDATELINSVLSNTNNKVALVSFNSTATKLSDFTNNKTNLTNLVNNLDTPGNTNYYDGFLKAEEVLEGYQKQSNRELIMLFLTDGFPNNQTPNEVAEYRALKQMYPYMTINGIQYEMGDEVLEPIVNVSDNQFIANISSLNNVLFEASVAPYTYENFTITDYIDNAYWDVESIDDIDASIGDVDLTYDGSTPKVTWTMNEMLMSGKSAQLTIDVTLKSGLNLPEGSFLPTNKSEVITSELPEVPNENVPSTLTPVLKTSFNVTYEPNLPSDCSSYTGALPAEQSYNAFSVVQMSTNEISCDDYNFKGWEIAEGDPKILNDDYFKIIGDDVIIRATWSKVSISKAMDGEVHEEVTATLNTGYAINKTLKQLSGQSDASYYAVNTTITAIKSASSMSAAQQASAVTISVSNSAAPIYAWFDDTDGTVYIYSDADIIKSGSSLERLFYNYKSLADVSGITNWDTSSLTTTSYMFFSTAITDADALTNWDTSKVTDMSYMFDGASSLTDIDALANWDTSKVTNMKGLFTSNAITNIDALAGWNTFNVTDMGCMFCGTKIANIDALTSWNTSNVTDMSYMFQNTPNLTNIEGASGWDTSKVTNTSAMFYNASSLTDIDALANWDTSNVTDMSHMFHDAVITNIDALSGWDTSGVTNMQSMFSGASSLTDIDGASGWGTSSVTNMSSMFRGATSLTNIDGASNWNTTNVVDMQAIFKQTNITDISCLSSWNTANVTNMAEMFFSTKVEDIGALSTWNTSNVTNMNGMFHWIYITNIDALANWDVSNVTNMGDMFRSNPNLANIDGASNWDTSSVTDMDCMFCMTSSLTNIDGASGWNTSNVTKMSYMFYRAAGLINVNGAIHWNTTNVTDMRYMFYETDSLTNISGVANWNTSNVTNMQSMFARAINLSNIDSLTNWDTTNVTNMNQMFYSDSSITSLLPIDNWNVSNVTDMGGIFGNIPSTVTRPTWYDGT